MVRRRLSLSSVRLAGRVRREDQRVQRETLCPAPAARPWSGRVRVPVFGLSRNRQAPACAMAVLNTGRHGLQGTCSILQYMAVTQMP